ncbi:MAG: biotin-dependent carboxyltransferase [Dehalococcoidia bacterium]|nr:biotin-dependent carboxyltransferase [Dehalococcoidia bacterium]
MEVFEVIQPGPLTTIQDLGRSGYQQFGVPTSGALDNYAFRVGNLLVGNAEGAASLEITLPGCQLRALRETMIAIAGAELAATINGEPASVWESRLLKRGDVLSFPRLNSGCRAYLAVTGSIAVPLVMQSASTYTRAGIGGFGGRPLRKGDILQSNKNTASAKVARMPSEYIPVYGNRIALRVILGPQDDLFTEEGISTFLSSEYIVSTQADRMGYRLEGPRIQHREGADIISDGIPLGAIQVPGDGLPIILLVDRQTTGGYTKIATTVSVDIPRIAQAKPGDKINFQQVDEEQAVTLLKKYEQQMETIKSRLYA